MKLVVNGEPIDYDDRTTLDGLVAQRGTDAERVATMLNNEIVKRENRSAAVLHENDRIEILSFAGGG